MTDITRKRVLLLVPAITYRATDFVAAAKRLGLDVVIGSDGALPLGGQPVVRVDPDDPGASAQNSRARSARSTRWWPSTARCCPWRHAWQRNSALRTIRSRRSKLRRTSHCNDKHGRSMASRSRLSVSWPPMPNDEALTGAARALGFPCVVKPVSLSGSRGVIRADDGAEVLAAAQVIRGILAEIGRPGEPIVIEEFVPGWELSIDGLLTEGALAVTAIFDKPDMPDGPTFEETMLVTPSRLAAPLLARACRLAEQAATALGLRYGPIHAELRIDTREGGERLAMLELAARSIGGLCSRSLRFAEGISLETLILENSLGGRHLPGMAGAAGVLMLPWNAPACCNGSTARPMPWPFRESRTLDHDPAGPGRAPAPLGRSISRLPLRRRPRDRRGRAALRDAYRKLQAVIIERSQWPRGDNRCSTMSLSR